jgi:hypothetical protein
VNCCLKGRILFLQSSLAGSGVIMRPKPQVVILRLWKSDFSSHSAVRDSIVAKSIIKDIARTTRIPETIFSFARYGQDFHNRKANGLRGATTVNCCLKGRILFLQSCLTGSGGIMRPKPQVVILRLWKSGFSSHSAVRDSTFFKWIISRRFSA